MKAKKTLKIVAGIIIFLTLPTLLFIGFIYFKYSDDLPQGKPGIEADALAYKMLDALDFEAYQKTKYIEWTFKNKHHFKWDKANDICTVLWEEYKVDLHLKFTERSKAYVHSFIIKGEKSDALVQTALEYFNNDSFWLVAPYKVFDEGVERSLVKTENNKDALLITYTSGGSTPGDSYLWLFDDSGKPTSFKMWTELAPIDGLEASWRDWTTTTSGAQLPTLHKILFMGLEIKNIKGTR